MGGTDPVAISFKPHQCQLEDFSGPLKPLLPGLVEGEEGRKAVEIILAIYESACTGKRVSLLL